MQLLLRERIALLRDDDDDDFIGRLSWQDVPRKEIIRLEGCSHVLCRWLVGRTANDIILLIVFRVRV